MASSTDDARAQMLAAVGAREVEELFEQIPGDHRVSRGISLPPQLVAEADLRRHLTEVLGRTRSCEENLSFLGAGCWQHHVPAVCDEIGRRAEFLTPVWGTPSSDQGRMQAWFEFTSQLGELLALDFVGLPVYSWGCAAGHALRMAARLTGREEVLVPRGMDPERLAVVRSYCGSPELERHLRLVPVEHDPATGRLDLADLRGKLGGRTAAVYVETPTYLGVVESDMAEIAALARAAGAETIMGVDPISLGVLAPPGELGADIAVGTTQTLGVHMNAGGGVGGFIASRDEERYAREFPTLNVSICDTVVPGQRGFGMTLFEQSSYGAREGGKDWTGNSVYLWAVVNAVYMSLMGPQGFVELGETVLQRSHYAARRITELPGVEVRWPQGFFREFVVDFSGTGRRVAEIDAALRDRGIFGGKDLSQDFPELGEAALYCVTEVHTQTDVDRLVEALREVTA
ncbi:aminomethyl-transferring glycine dehydrogenase subunit GcvPA [Blastococcus sp. MG754426]|nr:aminomethyl-transferring glycine dehydrogenase subunit GcvPA [Blastococcus sp. MG754426]MCF6511554.1 aminomethyl-transferring glycine dehydrogenase subunit GcvPA [Blastococcus sp. MG754427]